MTVNDLMEFFNTLSDKQKNLNVVCEGMDKDGDLVVTIITGSFVEKMQILSGGKNEVVLLV